MKQSEISSNFTQKTAVEILINGQDINNEESVKISKIEFVENKMNTVGPTHSDPKINPQQASKQVQNSCVKLTKKNPKENEEDTLENNESSIVTADYIQQSMILE